MSGSGNAINSFLPWLRRGVSASIGRTDDSKGEGPRAEFKVQMGFNKDSDGALEESVTISLYGPGEVVGVDRQTVTRTWPEADSINAEANLFPMIEFDQPDLPWRYTPAKAAREDRLRPWICLIVLRNDEIKSIEPASPDRLLPIVTVNSAESLPNLDQSGAWAHVHVSGYKVETADKIRDILTSEPHSAVSRLLCPRRLDNLTGYKAFLVPAFERGRLAGLQQPLDDGVDALAGAWSGGETLHQLPVYYMWSFTTGDLGDFEYLATLLEPYNLGADVGFRKMSVSSPGLGLPAASREPMDLDGALISNAVDETDAVISSGFVEGIVEKLNLPDDFLNKKDKEEPESIVAPPLYGQVYADRKRLPSSLDPSTPWSPPTEDRKWFWQINIDPRRRVASGLGTLVVQANEQQLMASAWEQVEAIRRANREIRYAQLSMEISASSYNRNLLPQEPEAAIYLTTPSHNRVVTTLSSPSQSKRGFAMAPPSTVGSTLRSRSISRGALDAQWRKRASALGAVGRRQGRAFIKRPQGFLTRMGTGDLAASRPPVTPSSILSFSKVVAPTVICHTKEEEPALAVVPDTSAINAVLDAFNVVPEEEVLPGFKPEVLKAWASGIMKDLEPRKNIASGIKSRLCTQQTKPTTHTTPLGLSRKPLGSSGLLGSEDEIKPIMRAPEFPQPMYSALRDLSQDWLLPGVEKIPANSVSLLKANQHFIEAFMVGLNHEMARELLWNGYPTDMRGTYFSQFWDSVGVISKIPTEKLKDINPINQWGDKRLGENSAKEHSGGETLMLLIRGELLKRYPNTIIYAAEAKRNGSYLDVGPVEKHPIFSGTLRPDISFFGFDLTEEMAKGTNGDPGWFFVLQEQPSEPRFGLDVATKETTGQKLTRWRDASWGHLAEKAEDLGRIVYIDLNNATRPEIAIAPPEAGKPDESHITWRNGGSSDIAYITYQPQVRVAIHAKVMLPDNRKPNERDFLEQED